MIDGKGRIDVQIVHGMFNEDIVEITGEKDSTAAWEKLHAPTDVVGTRCDVSR